MANEIAKEQPDRAKWVRVMLRVSRILLVPALCVLAVIAGLIVGFVYVGGQSAAEAMEWSTWQHIFDLVFAE
jgi:hypothetical protein